MALCVKNSLETTASKYALRQYFILIGRRKSPLFVQICDYKCKNEINVDSLELLLAGLWKTSIGWMEGNRSRSRWKRTWTESISKETDASQINISTCTTLYCYFAVRILAFSIQSLCCLFLFDLSDVTTTICLKIE